MRLTLSFVSDSVAGGGEDETGPFRMIGEIVGDVVTIRKMYAYWTVTYVGLWNGIYLAGRWTIPPGRGFLQGIFEMWPADEEITVDELTAETADERELVSV